MRHGVLPMGEPSEARAAYLQARALGLGTVIVTYQNYGYHPLLLPLTHRASLPPHSNRVQAEAHSTHAQVVRGYPAD